MIEIENFAAGKYVRSGEHRCFVPSLINDEWTWQSPEIHELLERASHRLGKLQGLSSLAPGLGLFIFLFARREAVASSRIEGTRTELDETAKPEAEIHPERRDDWREVRNYVAALEEARRLPLPVSSRMIRRAHRTLMRGVRGKNKAPGEFRRVQNHLPASPVSEIFYPPPASEVGALMSDLEKFLHNDRIKLPALMRIAVAHYQFETIHPFLDGNGRIGRLIIPLYLVEKEMMDSPLLYMSRYVEETKMQYYENLTRARNGDMARWIGYFLTVAARAAEDGTRALAEVLRLKDEAAAKINAKFKRGGKAPALLEHLFQNPFISVDDAARECGLSYPSANSLVRGMTKIGLLREEAGRRRNRLFVFREYLDIFNR